jgi:hypothetical protein
MDAQGHAEVHMSAPIKEKAAARENEAASNNDQRNAKHSTVGLFVIYCRNRHGREFRYLRRPVPKHEAEEIVARLRKIGLDARFAEAQR